jgi:hypothetical protein
MIRALVSLAEVRRPWRSVLKGGFVTAAVLGLAACGGDDGPTAATAPAATPPAAAPQSQSAALTITNTVPTHYAWDVLAVGKPVHVDGADSVTALPGRYKGLRYLKTLDADRFLGTTQAVTFEVDRAVDVLVAFDAAASGTPQWLADWTRAAEEVKTSSGAFRLYRKAFGKGNVALGGNELGSRHYFVVVDDGSAVGNAAPALSGNPPTEIGATRQYSFLPTATDADGDTLHFSATNLPPWAALDPDTGALTGKPGAAQLGTYANIVIAVTDGTATTALPAFDVKVASTNSNSAPTISGRPASAIVQAAAYDFRPTASDPDGDPLTFSIANAPRWATFDGATGRLRGAPGAGDVGSYRGIAIAVSDGKKTTSLPAFTIQVKADAQANTLPTIGGSPRTAVTVGQAYSFTPSAADADGDRLTFAIANRPSWASFDSATGQLTGTPSSANVGTHRDIVISVSDGGETAELASFAISVNEPSAAPANRAPTLSGTPATSATTGQAYAFTPSAGDPDGDVLTFAIAARPSWAVFNANTGRLSGTPSSTHVGTYADIVISVSDGSATTALRAFTITVAAASAPAPAGPSPTTSPPPNTAPVISGTPSTSVRQGEAYSFRPTASDADGNTLTFSIANRPAWASFSTSTGRLSGTPSAADVGSYANIVITVSDGQATRSLAAFDIAVVATATGSATLTWTPPTRNTDGSSLTNLSGYRIYWGRTSRSYSNSVTLTNPGLASYVIEELTSGTWYFAASAVNASGVESALSGEASKSIP